MQNFMIGLGVGLILGALIVSFLPGLPDISLPSSDPVERLTNEIAQVQEELILTRREQELKGFNQSYGQYTAREEKIRRLNLELSELRAKLRTEQSTSLE